MLMGLSPGTCVWCKSSNIHVQEELPCISLDPELVEQRNHLGYFLLLHGETFLFPANNFLRNQEAAPCAIPAARAGE